MKRIFVSASDGWKQQQIYICRNIIRIMMRVFMATFFFSFNIVIIMIRIPGGTTFDLDLISVAATLAPFRLWFSRHEKSLRSFSFNNHFSLRRAPRGRIQNTVQGFCSTSHLIFFLEYTITRNVDFYNNPPSPNRPHIPSIFVLWTSKIFVFFDSPCPVQRS